MAIAVINSIISMNTGAGSSAGGSFDLLSGSEFNFLNGSFFDLLLT